MLANFKQHIETLSQLGLRSSVVIVFFISPFLPYFCFYINSLPPVSVCSHAHCTLILWTVIMEGIGLLNLLTKSMPSGEIHMQIVKWLHNLHVSWENSNLNRIIFTIHAKRQMIRVIVLMCMLTCNFSLFAAILVSFFPLFSSHPFLCLLICKVKLLASQNWVKGTKLDKI